MGKEKMGHMSFGLDDERNIALSTVDIQIFVLSKITDCADNNFVIMYPLFFLYFAVNS